MGGSPTTWRVRGLAATPAGLTLADDLALLCDEKDANSLYSMLVAASEGGVFSNVNDTDLYEPLPPCGNEQACPRGPAGMLQGAARWSELARTRCPQIAGLIIDDFWSNYFENVLVPASSFWIAGDSAATTWTFRGDEVAATPR